MKCTWEINYKEIILVCRKRVYGMRTKQYYNKKQNKNVSLNKREKKNVGGSGDADDKIDGGNKDNEDSVTLDELKEFEVYDSSADSIYVPMDYDPSDSYDEDDDDIR